VPEYLSRLPPCRRPYYGTTYPGPIGSVLTPHLNGIKEFKHLSFASSLCGACSSVCPVKIDLHHHLLQNRRNATEAGATKSSERAMFRIWRAAMGSPSLYALGGWTVRKSLRLLYALGLAETFLDPMRCGTVIARPCRCPPNRSEQNGEKTVPQAQAEAQTKETPSENSSRDRILQQIRAGLRTVVPERLRWRRIVSFLNPSRIRSSVSSRNVF